jgi:hypothetical protein
VVGGAERGARNLISANGGPGVEIATRAADGNIVQGNLIGTDITGKVALGNQGDGVLVTLSALDSLILGNIIAFNSGAGVFITRILDPFLQTTYATENTVQGNAIFANGLLGIDIDTPGVSPNDPGDGDGGGNRGQNFPLLTLASSTIIPAGFIVTATATDPTGNTSEFSPCATVTPGVVTGTTIEGTLNSVADTLYQLEFFANRVCDASGYGEGRVFLGASAVTTDAAGDASFTVTLTSAATMPFEGQ